MTISLAEYSQQKSTMTNNKLPHLANILQLLNSNCRVALQWIPAHCGVPRNKQTDTVAKQGAQTEQPGANVSYQENAIITKALMMPSQAKDACHLLSRPEQVIMVRLRTGTNQSNSHMYNKLKIVPSASCLFGEEDWQTRGHIFQNCKRHDQERSAAWPTETTLYQKLLGDGQQSSSLLLVWPCTANEKKKMKTLCTLVISKVQVYKQKLSCTMWCACHCNIDCNYEKTVHQWFGMFLFHSLVMFKEFKKM